MVASPVGVFVSSGLFEFPFAAVLAFGAPPQPKETTEARRIAEKINAFVLIIMGRLLSIGIPEYNKFRENEQNRPNRIASFISDREIARTTHAGEQPSSII